MKSHIIQIESIKSIQPIKTIVCDTFISRFCGLMLHKKLNEYEGIILLNNSENIPGTAIHMFFMNFDIAVIWINSKCQIVDKTIAKRWYPYYCSKYPAKYILETHTDRFYDYHIGDYLSIKYD